MNYDHELQQSTDNRYPTTAGILSNFYPERKENIYGHLNGHLNGHLLTLSIYFLSTEVKKKANENLKLSDRKFECNTLRMTSPVSWVFFLMPGFHKANFDHDNDHFWVKTKQLVGRMTAQPPNRFVLCRGRGVCCKWKPGLTISTMSRSWYIFVKIF